MDQQESKAVQNETGQNEPRIVRGRVDSLSLYEITDHELDILEKGSPESFHLNFGIFLLTVGLSFLVTLLSEDIQSNRLFTVFVVLCSVGLLGGSFLIFLWYRMRKELTNVVAKIKKRIAAQEITSSILDESKD